LIDPPAVVKRSAASYTNISRDAMPEQAVTANFVGLQNYSMPFARLLVINI
jgi:hypothetical protein